ncbi:MAG: hypothetical protein J6I32_01405 [Bacteroidaceae bacterium]|nr:hypothetical protein [Bacteroidaceae bacterium]
MKRYTQPSLRAIRLETERMFALSVDPNKETDVVFTRKKMLPDNEEE